MGIVNRRNAVVGWVVLKVGKRAAKKKAQSVGPARTARRAAAGALAALGGAAALLAQEARRGARAA